MTIFPVLEKTSKKQNKKETNKQAKKLKKKIKNYLLIRIEQFLQNCYIINKSNNKQEKHDPRTCYVAC